jgi:structure-specific endonuclease subunit SLX1
MQSKPTVDDIDPDTVTEANDDNDDNDNDNDNVKSNKFFVYLLESSSKRATYVGATVNPERRLRQHNKELVGGAHATGCRVARGESWCMVCHISEFPTWNAALQFEWRFKQLTRKLKNAGGAAKKMTPVEARLVALEQLLAMDRPTSKAVPYAEWPNGTRPVVTWL